MEMNLLEKTELWIENVVLNNVNLNQLSERISTVFGIERDMVMVVDVRENHITFDILGKCIEAECFIGKRQQIFDELSKVDGFELTDSSDIHSDGILGLVNVSQNEADAINQRMMIMKDEIVESIKKRVIVFPTGFEIINGMIEDTNTPLIRKELESQGYKVTEGDPIADDSDQIAYNILNALLDGYGLIITTGGVGAEDKDKTVEAVLKIDQSASTPYIVKCEKGTGRHVKDGVKIAVGSSGESLVVSLPGPNDEVKIGLNKLMEGLSAGLSKDELATIIADALSKKLLLKNQHKSYSHL